MRTEVIVRSMSTNRIQSRYWLAGVVPMNEAMTVEQRRCAFGEHAPMRYGAANLVTRLLCYKRGNVRDMEDFARSAVLINDPTPISGHYIEYVEHADLEPVPLRPGSSTQLNTQPSPGQVAAYYGAEATSATYDPSISFHITTNNVPRF